MQKDTAVSIHSERPDKGLGFENLLTRQELCAQLNISYRTAEIWAHKGQGPRVTRLGQRAYYHKDDIAAWIEGQRQKSAARFDKKASK